MKNKRGIIFIFFNYFFVNFIILPKFLNFKLPNRCISSHS